MEQGDNTVPSFAGNGIEGVTTTGYGLSHMICL